MPDIEFMREATRLAADNVRSGGGPFGSVVVKDGEIIARGANRVAQARDPTAHAEVVAIREACRLLDSFQLTGCDIYSSSEPCPMCLGAIYWARPERVFYGVGREVAAAAGFDDGFIYEELARPVADRSLSIRQLLVPEAREPFDRWEALADRVEY
ncbi:MAG: nucleoside deaminase [Gemmatimonadota bacterium]